MMIGSDTMVIIRSSDRWQHDGRFKAWFINYLLDKISSDSSGPPYSFGKHSTGTIL